MKKRIKLFVVIMFLCRINDVYADASASISVSTTNTIVGNSGTATITVSSNEVLGQVYGTFSCGSLGSIDLTYVNTTGESATSKSYTINWTAKSVGSYTCSVSGLEVGSLVHPENGVFSISATSKTIQVISGSGSSSSGSSSGGTVAEKKEYSSNNDLTSLVIEGYQISPEFSQDVTEYTLVVDESVEKINVQAKPSDDKASVTGTGEINLSSGENTVEIKVTAENGNEKIYKILITVEDQNPITVKIGKNEFTVVKKNNNLINKLEYYEETTVKISDQDVIAYKNEKTGITLVLLKDKNNKIAYYVYNEQNNTYSEYHFITVQGVTIQLLDATEKLAHYQEYTLKLQDQTITYYKLKESHKVGLIYGTNVKTGNTGYYVYDQNEETLSKYFDDEVTLYKNEMKKLKNYLMIFMGVVSFVAIIVIVISIHRGKRKRTIKRLK